jgi:hypothetical protein
MPAYDGFGFDNDQDVAPAGPQDHRSRIVVQKTRSKMFRGGRGRFRLRTATCCRRARISNAVLFWLNWKRREASGTWNHQLEKVPHCQWHRHPESPGYIPAGPARNSLALYQLADLGLEESYRTDRSQCLENPRPKGGTPPSLSGGPSYSR